MKGIRKMTGMRLSRMPVIIFLIKLSYLKRIGCIFEPFALSCQLAEKN